MPSSEIPDQLHEKLSLSPLGWEAIVRLDWELDKDVPDDKCIIALDLIWRKYGFLFLEKAQVRFKSANASITQQAEVNGLGGSSPKLE